MNKSNLLKNISKDKINKVFLIEYQYEEIYHNFEGNSSVKIQIINLILIKPFPVLPS